MMLSGEQQNGGGALQTTGDASLIDLARLGPPAPGAGRRPIVVVIGMHRSGTSLCSHILSMLGVDMADDSGVSRGNDKGHWERWEIVALQDEILALFDRAYYTPRHDFPLPGGWWAEPKVRAVQTRIERFLLEKMTGGGLFGFKDPRTARLLPLWLRIFNNLNLAPRFVLCLRPPSQIARSLHERDGLDPAAGEYRALTYLVDCFRYIPRHDLCVVDYDEWFADYSGNLRGLMNFLDIEWRQSEADLSVAVTSIVDHDLRHGEARAGVARQPLARSFHNLATSLRGDPSRREEIDRFVNQFVAFQQLLWPFERAQRELSGVAARVPDLEAAVAGLEATAQARAEGEQAAAQVLAAREGDLERARAEQADVARRLAESQARVSDMASAVITDAAAAHQREQALGESAAELTRALETARAEQRASAAQLAVAEARGAASEAAALAAGAAASQREQALGESAAELTRALEAARAGQQAMTQHLAAAEARAAASEAAALAASAASSQREHALGESLAERTRELAATRAAHQGATERLAESEARGAASEAAALAASAASSQREQALGESLAERTRALEAARAGQLATAEHLAAAEASAAASEAAALGASAAARQREQALGESVADLTRARAASAAAFDELAREAQALRVSHEAAEGALEAARKDLAAARRREHKAGAARDRLESDLAAARAQMATASERAASDEARLAELAAALEVSASAGRAGERALDDALAAQAGEQDAARAALLAATSRFEESEASRAELAAALEASAIARQAREQAHEDALAARARELQAAREEHLVANDRLAQLEAALQAVNDSAERRVGELRELLQSRVAKLAAASNELIAAGERQEKHKRTYELSRNLLEDAVAALKAAQRRNKGDSVAASEPGGEIARLRAAVEEARRNEQAATKELNEQGAILNDIRGAATSLIDERRSVKRELLAPLFERQWYLSRYPEIAELGADPLDDYLDGGAGKGRDPNPFFDTSWYLHANPDVAASGLNPLEHYISYGALEGRDPHPAFAARWYEARTTPKINNPLLHYLTRGRHEGRDTHPFLQSKFSHAADHAAGGPGSGDHSIREIIASEFDSAFYLDRTPDTAGTEPIDHFITTGWRQGRDPSDNFSVSHYLSLNPDVSCLDINPLHHFIMWGRAEGRSPKPVNRRPVSISAALAPILFVGHDGIKAGAQVVLLEIVRWYAEHTRRPIAVLLMNGGRLVSAFAEYAEVHVLHDYANNSVDSEQFKRFINRSFAFAYVNTVAAHDFHVIYDGFLKEKNVPLVLHVHELSGVIRNFLNNFIELQSRAVSFIAVSEKVARCLVDEFGCDERRVYLSNAFIRPLLGAADEIPDYRARARAALGLASSDFVVLGCGTVYARKGADLFVDTARKVVASGVAPDARFIWIGDGPELEQCRSTIRERGASDRIEFVGFRSNAGALLAAADVFFLSSREDPFPLVCLEAAQFATPSVYFEGATGISEFAGADAGVGVPSFDTDASCAALCALARDRTLLDRLGDAARARVMGGYTAEIKVDQIARHVQEVTRYAPEVSIIVPAYNHARFIEARLRSIFRQTIADFEVILLDDCSADATLERARAFGSDSRMRVVENAVNSGSPFKQWKLGLGLARSQRVWIAEGDDSASPNFLETLLPALDDSRVTLAFCATDIIDDRDELKPGALDSYNAQSRFPFDCDQIKLDGFTAVELGFGGMCLIVNASSTLMRKSVATEALAAAQSFKMCGDWLVYLHALTQGKMFYSSAARNYFRRHTESAVHKLEGTPVYFEERHRIANFVIDNFNVSADAFDRLLTLNEGEWKRFRDRIPGVAKSALLRHDALVAARAKRWRVAPLRIGLYVHGMLFSKGGIERLAAELANALTRRGHSVWIFCRVWGSAKPVYELNESIEVVPVFDENDIDGSIPRLRLEVARRGLDCFAPMLSEWLFDPIVDAVHTLDVPILASEHNDPWKIEALWWSRERRAACFRKVAAVHLLLERFRDSLPDDLAPRIHVIPNGLRLDAETLAAPVVNRPKRFIGVGRLEPQKRFDRLIKAFARINRDVPDWSLTIFGEGRERLALQALIDNSGLGQRVSLGGRSERILEELTRSSVFVLPSEFEGFGIVVLEAKMAGLPGIAYVDCNGPNALIRHNRDGLLVESDEDGQSLGAAMLAMARDEVRRLGMATRARESTADFAIEAIVDRWEEVLASIAGEGSKLHMSAESPPLIENKPVALV